MSPRTSRQLCVRISDIFASLGIGRLVGAHGKGANVLKCRVRELGRQSTPPDGGPPIKARPYFLRLTTRHQTEDDLNDLLRSPKAGALDQPVEPSSLHRQPILQNADSGFGYFCFCGECAPTMHLMGTTDRITICQCPRHSDPFGLPLALK
jgi:hypothetical protein